MDGGFRARIDRAARPNPWVPRRIEGGPFRVRLFCFPYAGGSVAAFNGWRAALPGRVELCAVELPGRGFRWSESAYLDFDSLLRAAARALRPLLDVPFAFFGHSMGALVAFELARLTRTEGLSGPVQLIVSGHRAAHLDPSGRAMSRLADADLVRYVRDLNGVPPSAFEDAELLSLMLPTLRADLHVIESYRYRVERPLGCPIAAFGGLSDPSVASEEVVGWRDHTAARFSLFLFEGDHFFLKASERSFLRTLGHCLEDLVQDL